MKRAVLILFAIVLFFGALALTSRKKEPNSKQSIIEQDISKDGTATFDGNNFDMKINNGNSTEIISIGVTAISGTGGNILGKYTYGLSIGSDCTSKSKELTIGYLNNELKLLKHNCSISAIPAPIKIQPAEWRTFSRFSVSYSYDGGGRSHRIYFCKHEEKSKNHYSICEKP
ncbi:hypothetical protein QU487_11750 [Crenobacter sp. SG2305]|uniref:hypothetical protein n=1 Tax=Crenobacter oryzisoli TaxID=3056844 RepID=UPI0025AB3B94|nr:hypothetical protein [Crenobacter sp. SG2305]MDN0083418.1 hypothetical protein [Crenobacter sp. SG2305]